MWNFYHNTQTSDFDCIAIASLNVYYFLLNKKGIEFQKIDLESEFYEKLRKFTYNWKHNKIWEELNLQKYESFENLKELKKNQLPLIIELFHNSYGGHYVAAVEFNKKFTRTALDLLRDQDKLKESASVVQKLAKERFSLAKVLEIWDREVFNGK